MTREDQSQVERYLAAGRPVRLRINVQNSFQRAGGKRQCRR